jgi:hypothetical protein
MPARPNALQLVGEKEELMFGQAQHSFLFGAKNYEKNTCKNL